MRSLLGCPLIKQGALIGVLYLENNLASGVFSPERMKALRLISSEVATALENARLQDRLKEHHVALQTAQSKVELLEKATNHLSKFVPQSVRRIIEANPAAPQLAKRECNVSVLFLDIEGYTSLSETAVARQGRVPDRALLLRLPRRHPRKQRRHQRDQRRRVDDHLRARGSARARAARRPHRARDPQQGPAQSTRTCRTVTIRCSSTSASTAARPRSGRAASRAARARATRTRPRGRSRTSRRGSAPMPSRATC